MTDERLQSLLGSAALPLAPSPEFAAALRDELRHELGFAPGDATRRRVLWRGRARRGSRRPPLTLLLVAALLAATAGAALVAGGLLDRKPDESPSPSRLPEPVGLARNGVVAVEKDGDLYTVDPQTGVTTLLLGGPEDDQWVGFTPDGTRGVFTRWNALGRVGTVPLAGGAPPTFVPRDMLRTRDEPVQVAPNGLDLAFSAYNFGPPCIGDPGSEGGAFNISVGALDGGSFTTFCAQAEDYGGIAYLGPDGREIVYVALSRNLHTHDIRALDVTTGTTRAIVETSTGNDIVGDVSAAPDGTRIAYALRSADGTVSVHVVGADGSGDSVVGHAPGATLEAAPRWDPQGRRLLIERDAGDGVVHPVVVALDGGPDVVVDTEISENGARTAWAPDGASILAVRTAADGQPMQQELWDARTGAVAPVSWSSTTRPAWQRLAP